MQTTPTLHGEKFLEIIKDIEHLSFSQQKVIQDMLSQRKKFHKAPSKSILRKSFGLWADRDDMSDGRDYITKLRKDWQSRIERIKD